MVSRVSIDQALDVFLRAHRDHTYRAYARYCFDFLDWMAVHPALDWTALSRHDLRAYLADLDSQGTRWSPSRHAALRAFYRWAGRQGWVQGDPWSMILSPRRRRLVPAVLSAGEIDALMAAASVAHGRHAASDPLILRDRALLELLYGSGLRATEAADLDLQDLRLSDAAVRVFTSKVQKERVVPVGSYAIAALTRYIDAARPMLMDRADWSWSPDGYGTPVFVSATGHRLATRGIHHIVEGVARRAGIEKAVSPLMLRHSFASHLLDGGADLRVVQALLGHAWVTSTERYVRASIEPCRAMYARAHLRTTVRAEGPP